MTISKATQQQVATLLDEEAKLCGALIDALGNERLTLENRDIDAFNLVVKTKQDLATKLDSIEKSLFELTIASGFSGDKIGFKAFMTEIKSSDALPSMRKRIDNLNTLMTECQKQNLVNGQIVNLSMNATRDALSILSGRDLHSSTYNQGGKTQDKDDNQEIAIA